MEGLTILRTYLAIETSCDETSLAVLRDGKLLSLVISSQIELHRPYGGVVPELASRHHLHAIHPLLQQVLTKAKLTLQDIEAIAVTQGPGLQGSLLVGVAVARTLGALLAIPVLPINHMEGHLYSVRLEHDVACPFVTLICSGGHTQLIWVPTEGDHQILGQTRDDAAGEAFDKVAKLVGLPYPGGPIIDQIASNGNAHRFDLPRPMRGQGAEFSFSGLKTAVRRSWDQLDHDASALPDLLASFQEAVVDVLSDKLFKAARDQKCTRVTVVGGVACNSRLRAVIEAKAKALGKTAYFPAPLYCTDNAAMIGRAAWDLKDRLILKSQVPFDVDVEAELMTLPRSSEITARKSSA